MSKLSPDQVDAVLRAARPLAPANYGAFIDEVNTALAELGDLGDGLVADDSLPALVHRERRQAPPLPFLVSASISL